MKTLLAAAVAAAALSFANTAGAAIILPGSPVFSAPEYAGQEVTFAGYGADDVLFQRIWSRLYDLQITSLTIVGTPHQDVYLSNLLIGETGADGTFDLSAPLQLGAPFRNYFVLKVGDWHTYTRFSFSGLSATGIATAVPEPSTWAMMIAGFALVGASLRKVRARGTAPYAQL